METFDEDENVVTATFTDALDNLIVFAEKILHYDTSGGLSISSLGHQSNAIQTGLTGYRNIYNKTRTNPVKHIEKFKEVYDQCRSQFIREISLDDFMEWFQSKGFTITPQPNSRNKFCLTIIFRNCVRVAQNIASESDRASPEKAEELLNDPAAVYPEHFMLYLFRVFYHCADETDRQTMLIPRIEELEKSLGLRKDESPPVSGDLMDVMNYANEELAELGIKMPKLPSNAKLPPGMSLKQLMAEAKKSGKAKDAFKEIFDGVDLTNAKHIPGVVNKLMTKMSENANEVPDAVKRANEATADNQPTTASSSTK
jgi:hypothetical protein